MMNYAIFPLKALKAEQLPVMARLHLDDHGLLSQLGYPFVLKYFELVVNDAHVVGVIAVDNATHELIGYNIASPKPAALIAQLTKDKRWFLKEILKVALTRPAIFVQLLVSNAAIKIQMDDEADAIESLYLTIDERYRGQKVGRTLQQGLFEEARKAGYKRIVGSVETWNEASLRMCLSNGFVVKKTFREGKFIRHRIEKTL